MNLIQRGLALVFLADEEAATSSEYALLIALIAVAIMTGVRLFGNTVSVALFTTANTLLPFGG